MVIKNIVNIKDISRYLYHNSMLLYTDYAVGFYTEVSSFKDKESVVKYVKNVPSSVLWENKHMHYYKDGDTYCYDIGNVFSELSKIWAKLIDHEVVSGLQNHLSDNLDTFIGKETYCDSDVNGIPVKGYHMCVLSKRGYYVLFNLEQAGYKADSVFTKESKSLEEVLNCVDAYIFIDFNGNISLHLNAYVLQRMCEGNELFSRAFSIMLLYIVKVLEYRIGTIIDYYTGCKVLEHKKYDDWYNSKEHNIVRKKMFEKSMYIDEVISELKSEGWNSDTILKHVKDYFKEMREDVRNGKM